MNASRYRRSVPMLVAALCLLGLSPGIFAAGVELRNRYNVVSADKRVQYEMAEVMRLSDTEESITVLVRDVATGDRYVLQRLKSYTEQTVVYKISDPKGESSIQTSFSLPFTKRTRLEALQEARDNPQLAAEPVIVTIETNGGTWSGVSTTWDEWAELRKLRHDIRSVTSFYLLEGIERMRGSVFAQPSAQAFDTIVARFVVYDTDTTGKEDAGLQSVVVMPDCDFDESFGFPCTDAQQKIVRKARESGKVPQRY